MANVIFYLDGTPGVWFDIHERDITSLDGLKDYICELFRNHFDHRGAAKNEVSTWVQTSSELYISYIQHVIVLCHKVVHILKSIVDNVFNLFEFSLISSVDSVFQGSH